MSAPKVLICARADAPLVVAGSTVGKESCSECGTKVMMAPSGQAVLKETPDAKIVCAVCFLTSVEKGAINRKIEIQLAASGDTVEAEIRSAVPNTYRQRN